jgi:hypothetical protein
MLITTFLSLDIFAGSHFLNLKNGGEIKRKEGHRVV